MQPHEVGELGMSIGVHWPRLSSEKSTKGERINKVLFNVMNIDCHNDFRTIGLYCARTIAKGGEILNRTLSREVVSDEVGNAANR